jgi:hypothetical protein
METTWAPMDEDSEDSCNMTTGESEMPFDEKRLVDFSEQEQMTRTGVVCCLWCNYLPFSTKHQCVQHTTIWYER